jgi:hypothetical protein
MVDATTLNVKARLVSPLLNKTYGGDYGIQGQPYESPDGTFIIAANARMSTVSIIKPSSDGNTTQILELYVSGKPGSVLYVPKNTSVTYGDDKDPRNYYAFIGLGDQTSASTSGVAILDMADVVAGFTAGLTVLSNTSVEFLYFGASSSTENRIMSRGMGYVASPVYDTTLGKNTKVAFIDETTRKVTKTITINSGTDHIQKLLFVPIHTDELSYQLTQAQSQLSTVQEQRHMNVVSHRYSIYGIVIGSVALALAVAALTVFFTLFALGLIGGAAAGGALSPKEEIIPGKTDPYYAAEDPHRNATTGTEGKEDNHATQV